MPVLKSTDGFACTVCDATLKNSRTFKDHLKNEHDLDTTLPTETTIHNTTNDIEESQNAGKSEAIEDDQVFRQLEETRNFEPLRPLTLSNVVVPQKRKIGYNEAVWATGSSLNADNKEKKRMLLAAALGEWEPLVLQTKDCDYTFLASGDMGRKVLQDNPQGGEWLKPTPEEVCIPGSIEPTNVDQCIQHLKRTR